MSYITAIATANPQHKIAQQDIAEFMLRAMSFHNGEARKLKMIFKSSGIDYRYSVLADYGKTSDFQFYPETLRGQFPSTKERLQIYRNNALPLSVEAARKISFPSHEITHLIVVSCTGMYAPGLDIDLVKALNLNSSVHRTAINFMGCYAAFNALKLADSICKGDTKAKVLIICTEICSIHFQTESSEDNLLANALFADGSAAVLVEGETDRSLKLEFSAFHNELSMHGDEQMAWSIGDGGFEMKLSSYVPEIISGGIKSLTENLMNKVGGATSDIKFFAIHPGGKRILEVIEEQLSISKQDNASAYHVLKSYGNMSSATVLFVLEDLITKLTPRDVGEKILSFAFGPGLTMESMILKIKSI